ncbi:uncharacterized protein LOC111386456 [Olea europaea var. sylvestris]|uniref:uncharacterized protein LOC111386456 n=1 Tax=Olea europaea var. sylvestris TaxID=158386 RepID=UPI000C1D8871|nr:uncharacterized protein LOC111386456 [Olea europaea var. sylvestris]
MSMSLNIPPYFDGSNFAYWKVRMRAFLKAMDDRVWLSVVNGWIAPSTTVKNVVKPTPIENWTKIELDNCNWNSKALHALFMAISPEEFRRVSMCEVAKDVWDILETTHEGTQAVKNSKLQMLATRFEEIRMRDDEKFDVFYANLNDIINSSFNLGEKIPEPKIVRKILRSLPEHFRPKVTAIEESKDIDTIKVEELVGSLQAYELTLGTPVKEKSIALRSTRSNRPESSDSDSPNDEEMTYLARKFRKMFRKKKLEEKPRGGPSESRRKSKSVRCHKCGGFGHIRSECPSAKSVGEKTLHTTLTDDESSSDNQSEKSTCEENGRYVAFMTSAKNGSDQEGERDDVIDSGEDSEDESVSDKDIQEAYDKMYRESLKILSKNKTLNATIHNLQSEKAKVESYVSESSTVLSELKSKNETLESQVKNLTSELERSSRKTSELNAMNETLQIQVVNLMSDLEQSKSQLLAFSSSSSKLDNMLGIGKPAGNKGGLGYKGKRIDTVSTSKTTFVPASDQPKYASNSIPNVEGFLGQRSTRQHRTRRSRNRRQQSHNTSPRFVPTCFHCGKLGHIRPRCHQYLNNNRKIRITGNKSQVSIGQIGFLTEQVNHLTKLVTHLFGNRSPTK